MGEPTNVNNTGHANKIWILEDDPDIGFVLDVFLVDEGFETRVFSTAKDFLSAIDASLPDLFVLDVLLPDGNGIEICKELKSGERYGHIPVVLMSANASPVRIEECPPDVFIAKPFDLDHLRKVVQELTVS